MPELEDGQVVHVQGSAAKPYELKRDGDVYSCTCPAWLHQGRPLDQRTCKHLKQVRGEEAEAARLAAVGAAPAASRAAREGGGRRPAAKKEGAPPVLLAHPWEHDRDLTGWWMSEKLDGMRAYWDGARLLSRLGNEVLAPEWFLDGLPAEPLDGELWIARGVFQQTMSVVRSGGRGARWKEVRYVLFDAPGRGQAPFEERLAWLEERFPAGAHPHAVFHRHERCDGVEHLKRELDRVEGLGGEGLMLRQPGSRYVAGRSTTLLKVKRFFDAEARVVGHQPGTGKHEGRLGALRVVLGSGVEFAIGTGFSDAERKAPPPVGAVVTFRYQELSPDGVPRFGSYVGLRPDAAWPPDPASQPQPGARPPAPLRDEPEPEPEAPLEPEPETAALAAGAAPVTRRLELVDGSSAKFWEITVTGCQHRVRFGRIGAAGQTQLKAFPSPAAASAAAEKLLAGKLAKGYAET